MRSFVDDRESPWEETSTPAVVADIARITNPAISTDHAQHKKTAATPQENAAKATAKNDKSAAQVKPPAAQTEAVKQNTSASKVFERKRPPKPANPAANPPDPSTAPAPAMLPVPQMAQVIPVQAAGLQHIQHGSPCLMFERARAPSHTIPDKSRRIRLPPLYTLLPCFSQSWRPPPMTVPGPYMPFSYNPYGLAATTQTAAPAPTPAAAEASTPAPAETSKESPKAAEQSEEKSSKAASAPSSAPSAPPIVINVYGSSSEVQVEQEKDKQNGKNAVPAKVQKITKKIISEVDEEEEVEEVKETKTTPVKVQRGKGQANGKKTGPVKVQKVTRKIVSDVEEEEEEEEEGEATNAKTPPNKVQQGKGQANGKKAGPVKIQKITRKIVSDIEEEEEEEVGEEVEAQVVAEVLPEAKLAKKTIKRAVLIDKGGDQEVEEEVKEEVEAEVKGTKLPEAKHVKKTIKRTVLIDKGDEEGEEEKVEKTKLPMAKHAKKTIKRTVLVDDSSEEEQESSRTQGAVTQKITRKTTLIVSSDDEKEQNKQTAKVKKIVRKRTVILEDGNSTAGVNNEDIAEVQTTKSDEKAPKKSSSSGSSSTSTVPARPANTNIVGKGRYGGAKSKPEPANQNPEVEKKEDATSKSAGKDDAKEADQSSVASSQKPKTDTAKPPAAAGQGFWPMPPFPAYGSYGPQVFPGMLPGLAAPDPYAAPIVKAATASQQPIRDPDDEPRPATSSRKQSSRHGSNVPSRVSSNPSSKSSSEISVHVPKDWRGTIVVRDKDGALPARERHDKPRSATTHRAASPSRTEELNDTYIVRAPTPPTHGHENIHVHVHQESRRQVSRDVDPTQSRSPRDHTSSSRRISSARGRLDEGDRTSTRTVQESKARGSGHPQRVWKDPDHSGVWEMYTVSTADEFHPEADRRRRYEEVHPDDSASQIATRARNSSRRRTSTASRSTHKVQEHRDVQSHDRFRQRAHNDEGWTVEVTRRTERLDVEEPTGKAETTNAADARAGRRKGLASEVMDSLGGTASPSRRSRNERASLVASMMRPGSERATTSSRRKESESLVRSKSRDGHTSSRSGSSRVRPAQERSRRYRGHAESDDSRKSGTRRSSYRRPEHVRREEVVHEEVVHEELEEWAAVDAPANVPADVQW